MKTSSRVQLHVGHPRSILQMPKRMVRLMMLSLFVYYSPANWTFDDHVWMVVVVLNLDVFINNAQKDHVISPCFRSVANKVHPVFTVRSLVNKRMQLQDKCWIGSFTRIGDRNFMKFSCQSWQRVRPYWAIECFLLGTWLKPWQRRLGIFPTPSCG